MVCISKEQIEKLGLDVPTTLFLISLYFNSPIENIEKITEKAFNLGLVSYQDFANGKYFKPKLTLDGINKIESVFINSEFTPKVGDKYDIMATRMREIFPEGRKAGTNYMWRDSQAVIVKRLKGLVKKFDADLDVEQVIDATKRYVTSFNGDYTYMQLLKYFIMKKDLISGDENSQLLSYLENKDNVTNNNWQDSVR